MKASLRILALLLPAILLLSCRQNRNEDFSDFISDDTVRLEIDGVRVFTYNPALCQLAFNEKRCEFRAHSDTMLDYFVLSLDSVPESTGTKVKATLIWTTQDGERSRKDITLDTKRVKGDVLWLSDDNYRNAVVVRVLK